MSRSPGGRNGSKSEENSQKFGQVGAANSKTDASPREETLQPKVCSVEGPKNLIFDEVLKESVKGKQRVHGLGQGVLVFKSQT